MSKWDESNTITFRHDRAEMRGLLEWVDARIEELQLTGRPAYAVRLCVEEAVLNVLSHSVPLQGTPAEVIVTLGYQAGTLTAQIEDNGPAFDPRSVKGSKQPMGRTADPIGGQGIPLMRRFVRDMGYQRVDGANRLTLQFED